MLFNLGSAYCLRSEYDKARKCLHQVRLGQGRASCGAAGGGLGVAGLCRPVCVLTSGRFVKRGNRAPPDILFLKIIYLAVPDLSCRCRIFSCSM